MVRHVVLFRARKGVSNERIAEIYHGIKSLKNKISGIEEVSCGANESSEKKDHGYNQGFVVDFTDAAARDAYLPHPAHLELVNDFLPIIEGGEKGVLVFDYDF